MLKILATICLTCCVLSPALAAPPAPILIESTKQLFLDDYLIASMTNVQRTVQRAEKFAGNPVISQTEDWEAPIALMYGSIIREGGTFKMWYLSRNNPSYGVSYATSRDGIHWKKPRMKLAPVNGEPSNILFKKNTIWTGSDNVPYFQELFGVLRDEREADPSRRYKMAFLDIDWNYQGPDNVPWHKNQRRGVGVAGSPDGIHWKVIDNWATVAITDGATHFMFDPKSKKFILYGRSSKELPEVVAAWSTNEWYKQWYSGRAVGRIESDDFVKWDYTRPQTAPVVLVADLKDPPITEIYSMKVFPYEGIYVGLVQVLHATPDDPYLDVQLAVSRDTVNFERVGDRGTFIARGTVGDWDRFNHSLANNDPVAVGDDLRFYYSGRLYRHEPYAGADKGALRSGIGFASIKRDRFVSLDGSFDGAEVVTHPVELKSLKLHLNAKSDFGHIFVEIVDAKGKLLARSKAIAEDGLDIPVEWTGQVEPIEGPVSLRFKLSNSRLFALWCE